jgi:hypothetical protein
MPETSDRDIEHEGARFGKYALNSMIAGLPFAWRTSVATLRPDTRAINRILYSYYLIVGCERRQSLTLIGIWNRSDKACELRTSNDFARAKNRF